MRSHVAVGIALAASLTSTAAQSIKFLGLPTSATYSKPQVLAADGSCPMSPYSYSGTVAPFDEELSMIFRGPIQIAQIAVYNQQAPSKIKRSRHAHQRRHGHLHDQMEAKRDVEAEVEAKIEERQEVYATINGKVDSWANDYFGSPPTPAPAAPIAQPPPPKAAMGSVEETAPAPEASTNVGAGNWARTAYYEASSGTATGLSFLQNNNWVNYLTYGAVLGYVSSDGQAQSGQPAILEDTLLPDNFEIVVSSAQACNGDCGAVAPDATAYHGFAGANKIFMAEYSMPLTGDQSGLNPDKPGFWLLNSQIVNTVQYAACSCWISGCGEFDVHEVLATGATVGYATLHGGPNFQGQAPGAIARPTTGTIKIVAVIAAGQVSVHVLPADFSFDSTLSSDAVSAIINSPDIQEFSLTV